MASVRRMWVCKNPQCKNEKGKHRGYKKVDLGEKSVSCKHCGEPMEKGGYRSRISRNGKQITKTTRTKSDADAHNGACVVARKRGDLIPGAEPMISWAQARKIFMAWLDDRVEANELSPRTRSVYNSGLIALEKYRDKDGWKFSDFDLQKIEKGMVEAFRKERGREVKPATVNSSLDSLKRMYSVVADGLKASEYPRLHEQMTDIYKVKSLETNNKNDNILETEEEIRILLEECKTPHLYHFVFGILNTGLRNSFQLNLKTTEIFFEKNKIIKQVKGGTIVHIPLTPQYREYLLQWLKNQKVKSKNRYVIPSTKNPDNCYVATTDFGFNAAKGRCAVRFEKMGKKDAAARFRKLTPHHLRHTFATHFIYKNKGMGRDMVVHILSKILGHSGLYITERYSHALDDIQQAAMADFGNEMFAGVMG